MNSGKIKKNDKIFSTGVHLEPVECIINGIKQWRWIAIGFEDDVYFEGEIIDIYEYAEKFEGLQKDSIKVF
jgi:hypothetical protein